MISLRSLTAVTLALVLSACAGTSTPPSRGVMTDAPAISGARNASQSGTAGTAGTVVLQSQYQIVGANIIVPQKLRVSEANMFYPIADIVWRGEPRGDRYRQVEAIYQEAFAAGTAKMTSGRKAVVDIEVTRFHCLTEKTRYTVGGVHSLHFMLTVRDADTGVVIDGPRAVVADVKAAGGAQAIAEDDMGMTQRVVVVQRLSEVIHRELSTKITDPALVSRFLEGQSLSPAGLGG